MVWWKFLVVNNSDLIHPVYILLFAQSFLGDQTKGHSPMRWLNIHSNLTRREVSYSGSPPEPPPPDTPSALRPYSTQLHSSPPPLPPPLATSAPASLPHIFTPLKIVKGQDIRWNCWGAAFFRCFPMKSRSTTVVVLASTQLVGKAGGPQCIFALLHCCVWWYQSIVRSGRARKKCFLLLFAVIQVLLQHQSIKLYHAYMYLRVQVQRKNPK